MDVLAMFVICGFIISPTLQASVPESDNGLTIEEIVPVMPSFQEADVSHRKSPAKVPQVQDHQGISQNDFEKFFQKVKSIVEEKAMTKERQNMLKQLSKNKSKYWKKMQEGKKYKKWLKQFMQKTSCGQQDIQPLWPNFRIVGGKTAIPGSWPWMVSLFFDLVGEHWCAGSLISQQWILTARHCFDFPFNNTRDWVARLGKFDISQEEETETQFGVKQIFGHPGYNPANFDNDIALVQLDRLVEFNEYVSPICLKSWNTYDSTDCVITGWGKVSENSTHLSDLLKQVDVPVMKQDECTNLYPDRITSSMFCAGVFRGGQDACAGDSGGPLQCSYQNKWYVKGITSWGGLHFTECGQPYQPGVYTRVRQYHSWIYRTIFQNRVDKGARK